MNEFLIHLTSVLNQEFVTVCSTLRTNSWFKKDTSKLMLLVRFSDQKFVTEWATHMKRISDPPH